MTDNEFTPGPWGVKSSGANYPMTITAPSASDKSPGTVGTQVLRWGCFMLPSSDEAKANARLIASAPELLEALEAFEYQLGGETDPVKRRFADARTNARAAIAKARGNNDR